MPPFKVSATHPDGSAVERTVEAASFDEAYEMVKSTGLRPYKGEAKGAPLQDVPDPNGQPATGETPTPLPMEGEPTATGETPPPPAGQNDPDGNAPTGDVPPEGGSGAAETSPVSTRMYGRPDEGKRARTKEQIEQDNLIAELAEKAQTHPEEATLTADELLAALQEDAEK